MNRMYNSGFVEFDRRRTTVVALLALGHFAPLVGVNHLVSRAEAELALRNKRVDDCAYLLIRKLIPNPVVAHLLVRHARNKLVDLIVNVAVAVDHSETSFLLKIDLKTLL